MKRLILFLFSLWLIFLCLSACDSAGTASTLPPTNFSPSITAGVSSSPVSRTTSKPDSPTPLLSPSLASVLPSPSLTLPVPTLVPATPGLLPSPTSPQLNLPAPPPTPLTASSPVKNPTPLPASFELSQKQIGPPNCCQSFNYASDGRVYFYDKQPSDPGPATFVFDPQTGSRKSLTNLFGIFHPSLGLVSVPDRANGTTIIQEPGASTPRTVLKNRASQTLISPDQKRVVYLLRGLNQAGPEVPQPFELWAGNLDGSNQKAVWNLTEGANLSWFPDSRRVLLTARDASNRRFGLWVIDLEGAPGSNASLIVEGKGITAASLSKDGSQVVYAVTLQGVDNSGIWLAKIDGTARKKFNWVGSWRWSRAEPGELFYILPVAGGSGQEIWSFDTTTGQGQKLSQSNKIPVPISGDAWEVSPDNGSLIYRNSLDKALWLLRFRPPK